MATTLKITDMFGKELAELLALKIALVYEEFPSQDFIRVVDERTTGKTYTERIAIIAEVLHENLPPSYEKSVEILMQILGPENSNETGMFTFWYWLMPVAKFVELYGTDHRDLSFEAIEEITKRNTGEYAIRPYIRKYPEVALGQMEAWARSDNFHLRRLASEGLRPKLPWSPKLDTFNDHPQPVFDVLELLKEDEIMFVKKSVANHLTDWLKVNHEAVRPLIAEWKQSDNVHTQWIIKHATRKLR